MKPGLAIGAVETDGREVDMAAGPPPVAHGDTSPSSEHRWFLLLTLPLVVAALGLLVASGPLAALDVAKWYDPVFFQFNLVLLLTAVLFLPTIVWRYVLTMADEKAQRLAREIPARDWATIAPAVHRLIAANFRFRRYVGSVAALMLVVLLGGSAILLLKPSLGEGDVGVSYALGANVLMVGPLMLDDPDSAAYQNQIVVSLTAFQFGFLGAYVYFLTHLVRSYFTLDLSPSTFVEGSVRMVTASLLALVLGFALPIVTGSTPTADPAAYRQTLYALPVIAFFLGYFPSRALLLIEKTASSLLAMTIDSYRATSLGELSGMSYAHEVRLVREGVDNLENLARADALDLALRTGFGYVQLADWIGEAWLRERLGEEGYDRFRTATGLLGRRDLDAYLARRGDREGAIEELAGSLSDPKAAARLRILCCLLLPEAPRLPQAA